MQKFRHRNVVAVVLGLSLISAAFSATHAQPIANGRIRIHNALRGVTEKGAFLRIATFVTLFKNGEMVRSSDLTNSPNNAAGSLDWSNLPLGSYEVHFQTKGYGTVIKKVALTSDAMSFVNLENIGQNDEVWDGGPTVFEMEAQILALQKRNADLEARLSAVEKSVKK